MLREWHNIPGEELKKLFISIKDKLLEVKIKNREPICHVGFHILFFSGKVVL